MTTPGLGRSVHFYAGLSVAAAILTIGLKSVAYWLTGSVAFLADALESLINLIAALLVLYSLRVAARPPDQEHPYGHEKVEYFSSGSEGTLVAVAALAIMVASVERLLNPQEIPRLDLGLVLLIVAAGVNWWAATQIMRGAREFQSIALEADARHLMTDVWTSVTVLVAVGTIRWTDWVLIDPLVALAVAVYLGLTGYRLLWRSLHGLLDRALPQNEVAIIEAILARYLNEGIRYHALRTRMAGPRRFVSFHLQVPGQWSIQRGHDLVEDIEVEIRRALQPVSVFSHLEPIEDPVSWEDESLDRPN